MHSVWLSIKDIDLRFLDFNVIKYMFLVCDDSTYNSAWFITLYEL